MENNILRSHKIEYPLGNCKPLKIEIPVSLTKEEWEKFQNLVKAVMGW